MIALHPCRLTIRTNATNLGRSNTRNALLEGSGAEYCIFFDDDVEPWPGCIDAYVRAFVAHPAARCFAGPTYMPQAPRMLPMAFRMSGAWCSAWSVAARLCVAVAVAVCVWLLINGSCSIACACTYMWLGYMLCICTRPDVDSGLLLMAA